MRDLIDKQAAIKIAESYGLNNGTTLGRHSGMADLIAEELSNLPTIDAEPVVHGQWVPLEYDGFADGNPVWDLWECSECGEEHSGDEDTLTPYCPNCGAKMKAGDQNE